jgi:isochorismate hydrolase
MARQAKKIRNASVIIFTNEHKLQTESASLLITEIQKYFFPPMSVSHPKSGGMKKEIF